MILNRHFIIITCLIKDHPDYVGTYYHLGKLYEKNQEPDKAIETYKKE